MQAEAKGRAKAGWRKQQGQVEAQEGGSREPWDGERVWKGSGLDERPGTGHCHHRPNLFLTVPFFPPVPLDFRTDPGTGANPRPVGLPGAERRRGAGGAFWTGGNGAPLSQCIGGRFPVEPLVLGLYSQFMAFSKVSGIREILGISKMGGKEKLKITH